MFACCCEPSCGLFSDEFTNDHVELWYEQLAGTWTDNEAGGYLETLHSGAVLKLKATNVEETANVALMVTIRAMSPGDVVRLCLGATADGDSYLYAEITDTGTCGEVVLGSTGGGAVSRVIHIGKTSGGSLFVPFFVAYDEEGWLHFGQYSGTALTTIAALQATAPGIHAMVRTGSVGASGVRFGFIGLVNHAFTDGTVNPTGGCFTHTVPCGYGGTDACFPNTLECTFPWVDSDVGFSCPALVVSGAFWNQDDGTPGIFHAAYRSDGDSKVVNGYPVPFQGNDMTATLSVWAASGASGKVRLYVDADANGSGGAYAELEIHPTGSTGTLQLFSSGGASLSAAIVANIGLDEVGNILQVQRDGSYLRAQLAVVGGGIQCAIAAASSSWQDGGYAAAETVDVDGDIAINFPGCWASENDGHPTIRPGDGACSGSIETDCRSCTSAGETIRNVTVSFGGALAMTSSPLSGQDDGGCCDDIAGTLAMDVNDWTGDCSYEKVFPWCYTQMFDQRLGHPINDGNVSDASLTVTVTLTSSQVIVILKLTAHYDDGGSPATAITTATFSAAPGGDPRQACDQEFSLSLASLVSSPFPDWELCEGFSGLAVSVEFST